MTAPERTVDPATRLGHAVVARLRPPGPPLGQGRPPRIGSLALSATRFAVATARPVAVRRTLEGPGVARVNSYRDAGVRPPRWWTAPQDAAEPAAAARSTASPTVAAPTVTPTVRRSAARYVAPSELPERGLPRAVRRVPDEQSWSPGRIVDNLVATVAQVRRHDAVTAAGPMLTSQDRAKLTASAAVRSPSRRAAAADAAVVRSFSGRQSPPPAPTLRRSFAPPATGGPPAGRPAGGGTGPSAPTAGRAVSGPMTRSPAAPERPAAPSRAAGPAPARVPTPPIGAVSDAASSARRPARMPGAPTGVTRRASALAGAAAVAPTWRPARIARFARARRADEALAAVAGAGNGTVAGPAARSAVAGTAQHDVPIRRGAAAPTLSSAESAASSRPALPSATSDATAHDRSSAAATLAASPRLGGGAIVPLPQRAGAARSAVVPLRRAVGTAHPLRPGLRLGDATPRLVAVPMPDPAQRDGSADVRRLVRSSSPPAAPAAPAPNAAPARPTAPGAPAASPVSARAPSAPFHPPSRATVRRSPAETPAAAPTPAGPPPAGADPAAPASAAPAAPASAAPAAPASAAPASAAPASAAPGSAAPGSAAPASASAAAQTTAMAPAAAAVRAASAAVPPGLGVASYRPLRSAARPGVELRPAMSITRLPAFGPGWAPAVSLPRSDVAATTANSEARAGRVIARRTEARPVTSTAVPTGRPAAASPAGRAAGPPPTVAAPHLTAPHLAAIPTPVPRPSTGGVAHRSASPAAFGSAVTGLAAVAMPDLLTIHRSPARGARPRRAAALASAFGGDEPIRPSGTSSLGAVEAAAPGRAAAVPPHRAGEPPGHRPARSVAAVATRPYLPAPPPVSVRRMPATAEPPVPAVARGTSSTQRAAVVAGAADAVLRRSLVESTAGLFRTAEQGPPTISRLDEGQTGSQMADQLPTRMGLADSVWGGPHEHDGDLSAPTRAEDLEELVDRVVERIEQRVVDELERRGRRHTPGAF